MPTDPKINQNADPGIKTNTPTYVGPTVSSPTVVTPGVATGTVPPKPGPFIPSSSNTQVSNNSIPGGGTSTSTVPVGSIDTNTVANIDNTDANVLYITPIAGGSNGQIQYNNNGQFGASANLTWAQNGLFVGGVPTSLDATGIITARNEYRFGVWSGFAGASTDNWGRIRLGSAYSSNTFYGFRGDPDIINPNRTIVISNEEQDIHQAMVLMDGVAYNTLSPNSEGTIFGVSVNQTSADNRPSTGFESGWKKIVEATNKGNFKIGGNIVISPSFQIIPPANNEVGIQFADGTFQYTAATGGSGANIAVFDETTLVTSNVSIFVFQGNGVAVGQIGDETYVEINGGVTVQEEGANVVENASTINFVGTGVTASNVGGVATITVTGGGAANTVYNAGTSSTVTLNYNNGQWQNYAPDSSTVYITISNIPTGGEMTIFLQTGGTSSVITWTGPTAFFWEGGDDQPSTTSGTRDVITIKNNGAYYFAKFSKGYT